MADLLDVSNTGVLIPGKIGSDFEHALSVNINKNNINDFCFIIILNFPQLQQ